MNQFGQTSLVYAATDGRHRPPSHPVYGARQWVSPPGQAPDLEGWRIRALRQMAGLSQQQLAHAIGVSGPAVCQWETEVTKPNAAHLAKLREVLRA